MNRGITRKAAIIHRGNYFNYYLTIPSNKHGGVTGLQYIYPSNCYKYRLCRGPVGTAMENLGKCFAKRNYQPKYCHDISTNNRLERDTRTKNGTRRKADAGRE
jgi:hypothetical protein